MSAGYRDPWKIILQKTLPVLGEIMFSMYVLLLPPDIKVACVVNLKVSFMDWLSLWLGNTN